MMRRPAAFGERAAHLLAVRPCGNTRAHAMWIDLTLLFIVALSAIGGWISGGIAQALRLFAAVAAIVIAPPIADLIEPVLAALPLPGFVKRIVALTAGALAFYTALSILIGLGVRLLHSSSSAISGADRALGTVIGVLKGVAFAAGFAWLLVRAQPLDTSGQLAVRIERSLLLRAWAEHRDQLLDLHEETRQRLPGAGSGDHAPTVPTADRPDGSP